MSAGSLDHPNLIRFVKAGAPIRPWLVLGPFYEDIFHLGAAYTYFDRTDGPIGFQLIEEIGEEARDVLTGHPCENEAGSFRGQDGQWTLARRPEPHLSWGQYFLPNNMVAAFLTTTISPDQPGPTVFNLLTRITCRMIVAVNGTVVTEKEISQSDYRRSAQDVHTFEADLAKGENRVTVALLRLGRMARVGCMLTLDRDVTATVPIGDQVSAETRGHVESQITSLRVGREHFEPDDPIDVDLGLAPLQEAPMTVRLTSATGDVEREVGVEREGMIHLGRGADLEDGAYRIECAWGDGSGGELTLVDFEINKTTPVPPMPGNDLYQARRDAVLERAAGVAGAVPGNAFNPWDDVARYALGRYEDVDEELLAETCNWIAERKDCADFIIHAILRLMCWERKERHLSPGLNAQMKDTILGWEYWVDEPGVKVMIVGTENHRFLCHVAELMAGQLFPGEMFTNSQQRGLYHATKGREYTMEWLRQRGRFGFDEWHSNSYFPVDVAPLLNVFDFAIREDIKLKQQARAVLDYIFYILAADSFRGSLGTTHGRSYAHFLKHPDRDGVAPLNWLCYGVGTSGKGMGPISLATSEYRPPDFFADLATDETSIVESKQRQGVMDHSPRHADFCIYRTPDFVVSGLQDYRKGEYETSTHVAQVTMPGKVSVFWSCPDTTDEGAGQRPDYWSGHTTLPRVIQHKNVLSLSWQLSEFAWMSHCFFESDRFDEVRSSGSWVFGKSGTGYIGVHSTGGLRVGDTGRYAGRELVCDARETTWIAECGSEADWKSFDAFVTALGEAEVSDADGKIRYVSPTIGTFVTGWEVTPTVNGDEIALRGYPMVESPWAYSKFGSGELAIRYGDEMYEIWFNQ
jgi:hypothetical protein